MYFSYRRGTYLSPGTFLYLTNGTSRKELNDTQRHSLNISSIMQKKTLRMWLQRNIWWSSTIKKVEKLKKRILNVSFKMAGVENILSQDSTFNVTGCTYIFADIIWWSAIFKKYKQYIIKKNIYCYLWVQHLKLDWFSYYILNGNILWL